MTREEAIEFIAQSVKSDVDMAKVADAIKALEQEPILDKISAEIEELYSYADFDEDTKTCYNMVRLEEVQRVIDKYKAEVKGEEPEI